jgi:hypothetical protein
MCRLQIEPSAGTFPAVTAAAKEEAPRRGARGASLVPFGGNSDGKGVHHIIEGTDPRLREDDRLEKKL